MASPPQDNHDRSMQQAKRTDSDRMQVNELQSLPELNQQIEAYEPFV
jgi:hypothetical protein